MFRRLRNIFRPSNDYDATISKGRRQEPSSLLRSEDNELTDIKRRKLIRSAQDLRRNFAIAAWAIRKHLDYVSTFSFQANTGIDALDQRLEDLMGWWSRSLNCDAAGRHNLHRFIRLAEAHRTVDGDVGLLKLASGHLQAIEGDRVRTPDAGTLRKLSINPDRMTQGVKTDDAGFAEAYCIHRRTRNGLGGGYEFDRIVPASRLLMHGCYDRFDQVRGVSPLTSAINSFRDVYESFDYALAKAKIAQLFGLVLYRDATESVAPIEESSESSDDAKKYDIDFGRGPVLLDLDPGDKAEFLENKTPAPEFMAFTETMIRIALLALDIPYSLFNVSSTTYSGGRMDWIQYDQSAKTKRGELQELLTRITTWRMALFIADGELSLPAGMTLPDLRWKWIPAGLPWIDPLKEVQAETQAIKGGLDNPEDICLRHGSNVYDNIQKTARVLEYARQQGVPLEWAIAPMTINEVANAA